MASGLHRPNHLLLVAGRHSGEQRGSLGGFREFRFAHLFHLTAQKHVFGGNAHFAADLPADQFIVTRDDLDRHAVLSQAGDGRFRGFLGRVEESDVPHKDQSLFVVPGIGRLVLDRPIRDCQHTEPVGAQMLVFLLEVMDQIKIHRIDVVFQFEFGAASEDGFGGAFGDQPVRAVGHPNHHRHQPPVEIEGNLVHFGVGRDVELVVQFRVIQHGAIQHVSQAGLEVAVEECHLQHGVVLFAGDIAVLLQNDAIHGQCAGLVRAEHIHRAEVLYAVETLNDHLLPAHRHRALGQTYGDDHRQHFRCKAHGHGQSEKEGLNPVLLGQSID